MGQFCAIFFRFWSCHTLYNPPVVSCSNESDRHGTRKINWEEKKIFRRVSEQVQQYPTTVEIQLKAERCKKFSTIAFVKLGERKKRPKKRKEKKAPKEELRPQQRDVRRNRLNELVSVFYKPHDLSALSLSRLLSLSRSLSCASYLERNSVCVLFLQKIYVRRAESSLSEGTRGGCLCVHVRRLQDHNCTIIVSFYICTKVNTQFKFKDNLVLTLKFEYSQLYRSNNNTHTEQLEPKKGVTVDGEEKW